MLARKRGYNAIYLLWRGMTFPNNRQPSAREPEISFEELFTRLEDAGVNLLRVKLCGLQYPLRTTVESFEPRLGVFNDWGGNLTDAVVAAERHGVQFQVIPFDNVEWRGVWSDHAWSTARGGFLDDARLVFTDERAIEAAKRRVDAIAERCGPVIGAWELCAEMSFVVTLAFWKAEAWGDEMKANVREKMVPWVGEMTRYIQAQHDAPVGNGQVFAARNTMSDDPEHPSRYRNELFSVPELDFALISWYGNGPLADKVRWLRDCQRVTGKPVYVEQYAPWASGRTAPYEREPEGMPDSKAHEWAAVCGEYGAVGPARWNEIKPIDEYSTWWGVASPEMAEISGVSERYSQAIDLNDWNWRGESWDERIESPGLKLISSWGDDWHVTAYVEWESSGTRRLSVAGLEGETVVVYPYDFLSGEPLETQIVPVLQGVATFDVSTIDGHAVVYLCPEEPLPPIDEVRTMRVVIQEMDGEATLSTWAGELERI